MSISHPKQLATQELTQLAGVGMQIAQALGNLDIHTPFELLLHLPRDYEDKSKITPCTDAKLGAHLQFQGCITQADDTFGRKRGVFALLEDATGQIGLRFFSRHRGISQHIQVGNLLRVFGEVKWGKYGFELHHPEFSTVHDGTPLPAKVLTPIYPTTKGLTQNKLRSIIKLLLKELAQNPLPDVLTSKLKRVENGAFNTHSQHLSYPKDSYSKEPLDNGTLQDAAKLSITQALCMLHAPSSEADPAKLTDGNHPARLRLKLEELTAHQLHLLGCKRAFSQHKAPLCVQISPLVKRLLANLAFSPTSAQQRVTQEVVADITKSCPMHRLVQGDVGAGKTLVAALAACHALDAGWQVALMAPTEILAEQHFSTFSAWFEPLGISTHLLTSRLDSKARAQTLTDMEQGAARIVIGTHALFQDDTTYAKLGLVIIDEQHRFGVAQRLALRDKGVGVPHTLVMTATPIPRTLAMSMYGDMDVSVIDELPAGRTPVTTVTVANTRRDEVIARVAKNCAEGKQAYWVCPLIETSEKLDAAAAENIFDSIAQHPAIRTENTTVGLVHGKMKADAKQQVMTAFKRGDISVLVATTVIEVGVDVPNASLMVIEDAQRLGLSQLHQLRGRVGRGSQQSFCVLLYSDKLSEAGMVRLNTLKNSNDGFVIAEVDMQLRGPGELLGIRQAGKLGFYVADLQHDSALLDIAQMLAHHLIDNPKLCDTLTKRWLGERGKLAQV